MGVVALAVRVVSLAALLYASVVGVTFWLVRTSRLAPFGAWPRAIRRAADPLLHPLERRLVRAGRNPQDAPLWLFGITVAAGLLLISLGDWLISVALEARLAAGGGAHGLAAFVVGSVFTILIGALIVRVIASWFGIGAYRPWFRPVVRMTEWLVAPIRRVVPPVGMVDFSPLIAWLILILLRAFLLGLLR